MTSDHLVVPVALWADKPPNHHISALHMMNNGKYLITGSKDGEICVWDLTSAPLLSVVPKYLIYGHSSSIMCIADGDVKNRNTFVTSSNSGEMCLWCIDDGRCIVRKKTQYIHTQMQSFKVSQKDCRLFCIGYYSEIMVLEPTTFNLHYRLSSKDKPDWIASIHIIQPPQLNNIVIIGLSIVGIVRIWTITDGTGKILSPIYDNDSKALDCFKSVQIISNPESMRLFLIVCPKRWQIYDATDFSKLCVVEAENNELWTGGNFITRDQVLIWSDRGNSYLYHISTKRMTESQQSTTKLKVMLINKGGVPVRFLYPPKVSLFTMNNDKLLIRGDSHGAITIWPVKTNFSQENGINLEPIYTNSLLKSWKLDMDDKCLKSPANNNIESDTTSCIYLPALSCVASGSDDGNIIILTILQFAYQRLTQSELIALKDRNSPKFILSGHEGPVSCLFYPNSLNNRYDKSLLLSGSLDFAVCLWNLTNGTLIHKFCVHAGEIVRFTATPHDCNERLANSICCIARDHSVSILDLKEKKCTMMASRQLFPVNVIKWKLCEDLIVIGCVDGSVYVWKTETGMLVKVLQGSIADETLSNCDEFFTTKDDSSNTAVELFKSIKQGNLSAIKNAATKGIHQLAANHSPARGPSSTSIMSHPISIRNLSGESNSKSGLIMLFDIESLIEHLLHDQNLVVEASSILLSILLSWGLEKEVANICQKSSDLNKHLDPACIGLISENFISFLLPSYVRKLSSNNRRKVFFLINSSLTRLTGHCLSHLSFVPSSPSLPLYTSLKHTAVELIGRGFAFWEPYLDVSKVLLGLLDLCSDSVRNDSLSPDTILSPKKSAQEAIYLIAKARPSVFITTLAIEVAKYNNKQQSSNYKNSQGQQVQPILVKAKAEILRNIEILITKMPLEVANLITETMDIILHCLDHSLLETRGLNEAFPAITKFCMVSYCPSTRRIAVGTVSGNLAIYELRAQCKPQVIPAHNSNVSACSFSIDGRYLASYSAGDNKLCFWLTTVSGLFGLGNAKTRCVGTIETPPIPAELIKSPLDILQVAKLIWFADKRVVLMLIDDRELCYQVA